MTNPNTATRSESPRRERAILLIEDDETIRFAISRFFSSRGFRVVEAGSCQDGQRAFREDLPDAVLLDNCLPDGDGIELLARLRTIDSSVPVLMLTGHGSIDIAVRAIKEGAEQFFVKPIDLATLVVVVERLLDHRRNQQRLLAGRAQEAKRAVDPFIGTSAAIRRLREEALRLLTSSSPVLILGETGVGKGVLARWLHQNGPRSEEAFVDLNCAGLSREFLDTELFGHEKGAFTGAASAKLGLFEVANGGTLFLDEIGDVDPAVQPKLLKVVEEQRFRRLGDVKDRRVDVRLLAATHANLAESATFRRDLYYRVSTLPLTVPSLRERTEDIPVLAQQLIGSIAADLGRTAPRLDEGATRALCSYDWPGNIRELRNIIERALLLLGGQQPLITRSELDQVLGRDAGAPPRGRMTLAEAEERYVERVLREEGGDVAAAAAVLGLSRSALYDRLKRYGLGPGRDRGSRLLRYSAFQSDSDRST